MTTSIPEYGSGFNSAFLAKQTNYNPDAIVLYPAGINAGESDVYLTFEASVEETTSTTGWAFSYDARSFAGGGTTTIDLEWSVDPAGGWTALTGDVTSDNAQTFTHDVAALSGETTVYFRLHVHGISATEQVPAIDNVSIFADLEEAPVFDPTKPFDGVAYDATNYRGYYYSEWFGWYYADTTAANWYYQFNGMGWIWTDSAASTEVYFWNPSLPFTCWAYTAANAFPWVVVWGAPEVTTERWYYFNASTKTLDEWEPAVSE